MIPIFIQPTSKLCLLKEFKSIDPEESSIDLTSVMNKGIKVPWNEVLVEHRNDIVNILENWNDIFSTGYAIWVVKPLWKWN